MALFFKLLAYFSRTKFYLSGAYAARFSATRHGRKTLSASAFSSRKKTNFRNCQSELLNRAVEILDQLCRDFGNQLLAFFIFQFGENAGKTLRENRNENFVCQQRLN